eukprot:GDKI01032540.1.p2 GENE.GDKI01032540.1~~GDKI01032540.1.p2  ORF type:complete len:113 (-),score=38.11 GDKI01032540.1:195-533(-)
MVYLEDFDEFQDAAQKLFTERPRNTRFEVKYRHSDAKLVVKVTDDKVCLKYRTDQQSDAKRVDKLTQLFMLWMCTSEVGGDHPLPMEIEAPPAAAVPESTQQQQKKKKNRKG